LSAGKRRSGPPGGSADAALAHLAQAGVVASIVEYGYVRLSVGAYNNHEDIERILRAARAFAA